MADRLCTHEEFDEFEALCTPWNVDERLRRESPPAPQFGLTAGNGFLLRDLIKYFTPEESQRKELQTLLTIWEEIENLSYSKALTANLHYQAACRSFEKRLRAFDERKKVRRRIEFRYLTGFAIYLLGYSQKQVRLMPDKDTARRVSKHINALLRNLVNPKEYAYWGDYALVQKLKELKGKMEASETVQRVGNTLSPEGYFAYYLAQRFLEGFGETMPTIICDLCRVIGSNPDESTVQRWTSLAEDHHAKV